MPEHAYQLPCSPKLSSSVASPLPESTSASAFAPTWPTVVSYSAELFPVGWGLVVVSDVGPFRSVSCPLMLSVCLFVIVNLLLSFNEK